MGTCESDHRTVGKDIITLKDTGRTHNHTVRSVDHIITVTARFRDHNYSLLMRSD